MMPRNEVPKMTLGKLFLPRPLINSFVFSPTPLIKNQLFRCIVNHPGGHFLLVIYPENNSSFVIDIEGVLFGK